jgi:hypothetical protein
MTAHRGRLLPPVVKAIRRGPDDEEQDNDDGNDNDHEMDQGDD